MASQTLYTCPYCNKAFSKEKIVYNGFISVCIDCRQSRMERINQRRAEEEQRQAIRHLQQQLTTQIIGIEIV